MMLSLICLQVSDCSRVLIDFLTGSIGYLLPKKFVFNLKRRRSGHDLNLNPELVAEAFASIEDPLMIVYSGDASPKIHAPSAIFVDLNKPKQEIMSALLPRKNAHSGIDFQGDNVDAGTTPEVSTSNTLPDANMNMNRIELQINWEVVEEISEILNGRRVVAQNTLTPTAMVKEELDKNIGTLATILVDQKLCSGKGARVVRDAYNDFGLLSFAYDRRRQRATKSVLVKDVRLALERLVSDRPMIERFVERYVTSQALKVKQTGDEALEVFENQSGFDNTRDGNNKKGNKGKKIERFVKRYVTSQALKVKQTGDDALEVFENQSGFDNTRDGNKKKGNKGKKSNKSKGKKK